MSVEELENLRKKARNNELIGIIISLVIGIILFCIIHSFIAIIIATIIGVAITLVCNRKTKRQFILAFKETFVLESLKSVFTDLVYEPERGLEPSIIRNTGMMNMGDRYSSNDYISGKYKNIEVNQADIHIEEEYETTDEEGNTTRSWETIFRGRWMVFDFNKVFKANIQVCQKGFGNSIVNNWGTKIKYKKVLMENQIFNSKFKTYAQNEHEAFYILTPSLMERIIDLSNSVYGKLLFCFVDSKLHIGVQNNKDSFEHGIYTKIDEEKIRKEISQDIKLITDFVDKLNLDNDLFRMEV